MALGVTCGDRALCLGPGQRRGKHCDVLAVRRAFAIVRFEDIGGMLVRAVDLHPIPRRPRPDF